MTIPSNIREPGSYSEYDASGANVALPAYRQPMLIIAPRIKTPADWAATAAILVGAMVKPTANVAHYYICIAAGTTGSSEPTWPGASGSVVDGTVTWREVCAAAEIAAVHTLTPCYSPADGARYAGSGSIAARMVAAALKQYRFTELTLLSVDDDDSGVRATASLVFAGTATAPGVIDIYIGMDRVSYSYSEGDTHTEIAAAVDALIALFHDLPVTPSVSSATLTLRAKCAGTPGNLIGKYSATSSKYEPVVVKNAGDGITVTVTGFASGATDPDLEDAFTVASTETYAIIAMPYNGAAQTADLKAYLNTMADHVNSRGVRAFLAITSSVGASTTLADINHERIHVALVRKCKCPAYEIAAMFGADHVATGHAGKPLNGRPINCDAPDIADRLESTEINALLWAGVTPYNADGAGVVRCVRSITTYQSNATGTPDPVYLDTTTVANLDFFRTALKARHQLECSGRTIRTEHVEGEPSFVMTFADIRSINIDVALRCEKNGNLQNVKLLIPRFVTVPDASVAGRANSSIPVEVVQGLHILANVIQIVTTN